MFISLLKNHPRLDRPGSMTSNSLQGILTEASAEFNGKYQLTVQDVFNRIIDVAKEEYAF